LTQKTATIGLRSEVQKRLTLDPTREVARIVEFIRNQFKSSGSTGIVVGLSGGIDSAVTASLCARAVGPQRVTGVYLFEEKNRGGIDAKHAALIADQLDIRTLDFTLDPTIKSFSDNFPLKTEDRVARGNLKARLRMTSLYYTANTENLLVAGTGDRSEDLIGYFTKYGDGGVDFLPIAHLYKSQVRQLGTFLNIPREIVEKPSSPNLWEGHRATDEIPLDYTELDNALVCLFDLKMGPEETAKELGIDLVKVREVLSRFHVSGHKRAYPPMIGGW
jgi:NAD+ synthase